jgi:hypothetical protein
MPESAPLIAADWLRSQRRHSTPSEPVSRYCRLVATTVQPRATSARTRACPMNPVAPVTSIAPDGPNGFEGGVMLAQGTRFRCRHLVERRNGLQALRARRGQRSEVLIVRVLEAAILPSCICATTTNRDASLERQPHISDGSTTRTQNNRYISRYPVVTPALGRANGCAFTRLLWWRDPTAARLRRDLPHARLRVDSARGACLSSAASLSFKRRASASI